MSSKQSDVDEQASQKCACTVFIYQKTRPYLCDFNVIFSATASKGKTMVTQEAQAWGYAGERYIIWQPAN